MSPRVLLSCRRGPAQHGLEERPARRHPEAVHQERDAPEVATDDVVLLPGEGPEGVAVPAPGLERYEMRVTTDLLLDRLELAPDLVDQLPPTPAGG